MAKPASDDAYTQFYVDAMNRGAVIVLEVLEPALHKMEIQHLEKALGDVTEAEKLRLAATAHGFKHAVEMVRVVREGIANG